MCAEATVGRISETVELEGVIQDGGILSVYVIALEMAVGDGIESH